MSTKGDSSPRTRDGPRRGNSPIVHRGQVCDRCREKRVKCDGATPSCGKCAAAGVACEVSVTLQRNTKVRGFSSTNEATVTSLRAEVQELRDRLQAEIETSKALRQDLERQSQQIQARPRKLAKTGQQNSKQTETPRQQTSSDAGRSLPDKSVYMIKHMGRLVHDAAGIDRFAGSTTGVHFVLGVEEACMRSLGYSSRFPESSFSLYLLTPNRASLASTAIPSNEATLEDIRRYFCYPPDYYLNQINQFMQKWESFCPILVREVVVKDVQQTLHHIQANNEVQNIDYPVLQILALVLAIHEFDNTLDDDFGGQSLADSARHAELACRFIRKVETLHDLKALQALVLFAFYLQISGQSVWLVQISGLLVRMAQSLGLHRHDRRFKFCAGEVELRRRLWWWIYTFDKITSMVHGLPQLISNSDVDNDMPTDCNLQDVSTVHLSHPFPGEITSIFFFNQYVLLGKKLSKILEQLYTTTARRGGVEKICSLDRDLRAWNQAFNAHQHVNPFEIGSFSRLPFEESNHEGHAFINSWLQLMANIAMVMIHRPGLTFDVVTPEFGKSLKSCVASCAVIIELVDDNALGWWLRNQCPSGPALVFQCALMHIYLHCNPEVSGPGWATSSATSRSIVFKAISILEVYLINCRSTSSDITVTDDSRAQAIEDAIQTLHHLASALPEANNLPELKSTQNQIEDGDSITDTNVDFGSASNMEIWNSNALGSLNNLEMFEWSFDEVNQFPLVP